MGTIGIRGRLFMGFATVMVILIITISGILIKVASTEKLVDQVVGADIPTHNISYDLSAQIYQTFSLLQSWLLTHDSKYKNQRFNTWVYIDNLVKNIDDFSRNWTNTDYKKKWQDAKSLIEQLKIVQAKLENETKIANEASSIQLLTTEVMPLGNKIYDIIEGPLTQTGERMGGIFDLQYQDINNSIHTVIDDMHTIQFTEYMLLIICIAISIIIALFTAHNILGPLNNAINVAKRIAAGERNIVVTGNSKDETGELLNALNTMQTSIKDNEEKLKQNEVNTRKLFEKIVQTANTFSAHSSKISAGDLTQRLTIDSSDEMSKLGNDLNIMTERLATITKQTTEACHNMVGTLAEVKHAVDVQSSGASEQASSINQITASLEEIEKSSNQTIEKAKALGDMAEKTREKGQLGLDAVEQSINGMKGVRDKVQMIAQTILDLSNQTQQVGEITSVVNALAQQSKMLALNASIEAAKAGEAGKGFAVVAVEVKNLAEQSEQSTTQVQKILENIRHATEKAVMATEEGTKGVDRGTELIEQTGEIARSLSDVIYETTLASQQIEAAIRQEGIGIEQITAGMNEINQVTTSFVESVKQTTEAIGNLACIAKSLKEYIDIYKI